MTGEPRDPGTREARQGEGPESADHPERAGSIVAADTGRAARAKRARDGRLDRGLFLVVCIVLGVLMVVLCMSLFVQYTTYRDAIAHGFERVASIDHASVIGYARALDFAVAKTTALFLAFTLVFVGALYVLRAGAAEYGLSASTGAARASLQTSSPGLVMVTLGVILIVVVLNTKSTVEYRRGPSESAQSEAADGSGAATGARRSERPPLNPDPPHSEASQVERR